MADQPPATLDATTAGDASLGTRSPVVILASALALFCLVYWTTSGWSEVALESCAIFLLPVFFIWWVGKTKCGSQLLQGALTPSAAPDLTTTQTCLWPAVGMAVVCFGIVVLEFFQPLYFTQDDSLANGVVGMVVGARSLFSGQFPAWNHCQYLGAPMASMGYWSLTYPPTYLSYLVATYGFGNEWWTMEVYQISHLLLSYLTIYYAGRAVGLRKSTATMASVAVTLSGTSLIIGRCWYATIPLNVWLPILVIGICQLRRGPVTWRWTVTYGAAMGILFHVGYPQTWVYAMIAFLACIGLLWIFGQIPTSRALRVVPAQMIGVAIASPLLWVLLKETRDSQVIPYGHGIGISAMCAMILPYPLIRAAHPEHWGTVLPTMGQMYYWGTVLPVLSLAGIASLAALRQSRRTLVDNYWLLAAAFWLTLTLGYKAVIWVAMGRLPGFSNFSCPFKIQQFFNLFAAFGGGLMLDRLLAGRQDRIRWERIVTIAVLGLMVYHCWMARSSFYQYGYLPYPELPSAFDAVRDSQQRVYVVAPKRSNDPTFPFSLQLNSATAYGIPVIAGYDPLVEFGTQTKKILANVEQLDDGWRTYGVRWVVIHRSASDESIKENPAFRMREEFGRERIAQIHGRLQDRNATVFYESPEVTIYEVPDPEPMAFAGVAQTAVPVRTDPGGLRVDTSRMTDSTTDHSVVTVNYAARPFMVAFVDGKPTTIAADEYERIQVQLPRGCRELSIRYRPPWLPGFAIGLALLIGAVCSSRYLSQFDA